MPFKIHLRLLCCLMIFLLTACTSKGNWAPVETLHWSSQGTYPTTHQVLEGETLYSLAFKYEQDYRQLAKLNGLRPPYFLKTGQNLKIRSGILGKPEFHVQDNLSYRLKDNKNNNLNPRLLSSSQRTITPTQPTITPKLLPSKKIGKWYWPAKGRMLSDFSPEQGKKGIDIAGKKGDKIHAAADGVIAYAGSGLGGYGNLIIIKHNNQFLTAYGNNLHNLVKEGERVKAGQVIAEMGVINRRFWGVHFEIRKMGKPINPVTYLNSVSSR